MLEAWKNRIQSKDHRIGTYKSTNWSCFNNKIYMLNNTYDGLVLGY